MDWTASGRMTGAKSVAQAIDCTSSRHLRYCSLCFPKRRYQQLQREWTVKQPPPSLTREATMQMQSTANGDRSWRASYVSVFASKIGLKIIFKYLGVMINVLLTKKSSSLRRICKDGPKNQ